MVVYETFVLVRFVMYVKIFLFFSFRVLINPLTKLVRKFLIFTFILLWFGLEVFNCFDVQ